MKIAVLGAGIGGLASARFLARDGHAVTIFERFAAPKPLGSGLVVQPVGLAVLDALGLQARDLGQPIRRMFGTSGAKIALDVVYPLQTPGLGMHRGALFQLLWQDIGVEIVTNAEVIGAAIAGEKRMVTIKGRDPCGPYDLVIDASGAQSAVSPLKARALPFGAIWAQVAWPAQSDLPMDRLTQSYAKAHRMAGVLPVGRLQGQTAPLAAVFWSMPRAQLDDWQQSDFDAWRNNAGAFWPQFAPFLEPLGAQDFKAARYSHGSLRRPFDAALVFIGDAAHRASPQLGQGANMALLDAMALAQALRRNTSLAEALPSYARARQRHLMLYQGLSAILTPMFQSHSRTIPWLRDHLMGPLSQIWPMPRLLSRLVAGTLIAPIR